jgi:hypothetical protein
MNWCAGMLRSWIVISALWIGVAVWQFAYSCWWTYTLPSDRWGPFPDCIAFKALTASDWINWFGFAFGPPVGLLCAGWAATWIIGGFRKSRNSN